MKQNSPDESTQIYADITHEEAFNAYVPGEPKYNLKTPSHRDHDLWL